MLPISQLPAAGSRYSLAALAARTAGQTASSESASEAAVVSLSRKVTLRELEKHLDDYSKGRGYLSSKTAGRLSAIDADNSVRLSNGSPNLSSSYLAYRTGLSYKAESRFVHGMNLAADGFEKISRANSAELPAQAKRLLERYDYA